MKLGSAYLLYDPVSRIKSGLLYLGSSGAAPTASFDHSYDGFGNLLSLTANGTLRNTPTSQTTNRLTGAVGYDTGGELTSWNGATYRYDQAGRMWGMKNGAENWV